MPHLNTIIKVSFFIGLFFVVSSCTQRGFSEKEIFFNNPHDQVQLAGTLSIPNSGHPVPAVVLVHGSGPHTRDLDVMGRHKVFKDIAHYFAQNGVAVLRYDKRGTAKSGGKYEPYDMDNFTLDGIAGIKFLISLPGIDTNNIGVIGLSQGGILAPIIATKCNEVDFIVMMAGAGVKPYELFSSSQVAMSKAAGFDEKSVETVKTLYDKFWNIIVKKNINQQQREQALGYQSQIWKYIDMESRRDFGFLEEYREFMFDNMYHHPNVVDFFRYDPQETLSRLTCDVLALNGDMDVQVVADINLAGITKSLESGKCGKYRVVELEGHNHLFQKCKTGKIAEYKTIDGTVSEETLKLILDWVQGR